MPKESAHKVFVEMHKREHEVSMSSTEVSTSFHRIQLSFKRGRNKMSYANIQMFMEKLKQLMYCNDIPVINNPSIICERPQFQILYEELDSTIQTIFNHEDQDLHNFEEVRKVKKRFKAAAEEAEDIVDVFLSTVHCRSNRFFPRSDVFQPSLHLEVAMSSIESIKKEFMTLSIDNMKMDSSLRTDRLQTQSSGTSHTRNSRGSKKLLENVVVGFDRDAEIIRDKLVEDGKHRDVVSIVGMGGIGKTTLANKVFTDPYVVYHFHVRGWVTVSQTYDKRDLLIQVLSSIDDQLELEKATDCQLRAMLHKHLMGKRYLIVIDDIWSIEAWDKSQLFFPDDNTGSRILLTSRLTEVASHAKSHGLIHQLQHLTEEESWKLLCEKAFQEDECPEWLIEPGKQIAKNCHGLPLSVVVMAGVLAKEPRSEDVWLKISCSFHSYIASDEKGCLETIALSYHHLPPHLRDCFLYLGGFPEDYPISSPRLLWLWMAEGFIQEDGSQSLKEIANSYLMDLVDRNLLIISKWYAWGDVRRCKVHDLVRQVCVEKGKEENFFLKIDSPPSNNLCEVITTYKKRRVVTNQEMHIMSPSLPTTPSVQSLLCFTRKTTLTDIISKFFPSFSLLRVLSLEKCRLLYFPPGLALLVHLRYLYIWLSSFPPSICTLWNLQTLIVKTSSSPMVLPSNISNLVNLRHLRCNADLYLPSVGKPLNLEFITKVELGDGVDNFKKCFPRIKELTSTLYSDKEKDFEVLHYLQILTLMGSVEREFRRGAPNLGKNHIRIGFPETLKVLTLVRCGLPWSDMSIIQSLPNLEALILEDNGFEGTLWETGEDQFQRLKVLRLKKLNIKQWKASSINFPCLERLRVVNCVHLEEIPLELGDISTLESIYILNCDASLLVSLQRIRNEQDDVGNYELKIKVDGRKMPSCVSKHDD
ncbi:late blight resistance protein R1-A isoform X1 [Lactuca sativa]|uniref:late blight resistance protein R1-A isoform X1 n=2 Tax=Lactuca sativa TaxID=4236 RepID=UPI000CD97C92|nr:late blight resistance protein R1-A isoform X1 [Lactuca sativa]